MKVLHSGIVTVFSELRNEMGLSLRAVAKETGISPGFLSRVESRRIEPTSAFFLAVGGLISKHFENSFQQNQGGAGVVSKHPVDKI